MPRKKMKIFAYIMVGCMLVSTLLTGLSLWF